MKSYIPSKLFLAGLTYRPTRLCFYAVTLTSNPYYQHSYFSRAWRSSTGEIPWWISPPMA